MRRRAFINGGTGAIGSQLVRSFASRGYVVEFSYNSSVDIAAMLSQEHDAVAYKIDWLGESVLPPTEVDILINNAGINLSGRPLAATSDSELRRTYEVNVVAPARLARHFVPHMKEQSFGRIININSLYGLWAPAQRLSYAASKFALRAVTLSLAEELAPHGITVNDICPGPVDSQMLRRMAESAIGEGRFTSVEDYLADVRADLGIGRLITPSDVAETALFLAGDGAAACTGLAVRVDGGCRLG